MIINLYLIFWVAPLDVVLGHIQKIFYIHVPIAAMSFLAFFLVFVFSIIYLVKRSEHWDRLAYAAGEVGVVFVSVTLLTGVVWAKPVWGVWWTWEPRLTTTLILWLIYIAYIMVRSYAPNRSQGSLYAAAIGIIGFIDVPIVYYSVQWWRSIHPSAVVGPFAESGALEPIMAQILLVSLVAFTLLFVLLFNQRISVKKQEDLLAKTLEFENK
ncbi:MAG: cytochrome C assembly protein [Dehalococcoidia bacterium]|nr:cytochrome C assembly protein [Dehalococcoidia bacterium]|tara:strand:+ start:7511 stop:8146 length:636 start_codon:yes stop_codon:yes gene_type:complete